MENTPLTPNTPESGNDKDSKDSSKKKKSAEAIGAYIVEPKKEQSESEKPKSLFEQIMGDKDKDESDEPSSSEQPVGEAEAPLESLSDEERLYVETEIVSALQAENLPPSEDPEIIAADAAVESFREKILVEGEDSETAFTETLNEINSDETIAESEVEEAIVNLRNEEDTPEPIRLGGAPKAKPRQPSTPNAERPITVENNDGTMLLVGGVVGYLVGRRRGRIKTEKRLVPIQKKLEKQVQGLQTELGRKEAVIRQVAAEKVRNSTPERRPRAVPIPAERIGKVLIEGGPAKTEAPKRFSPVEGLTEKDIITLNRVELLAVSEKIIVEGSSLRQIYETRLVGEKGLRRLVAEFLRGGNLNKALKRELIEKEIDFERDPILRDKNRAGGSEGGGKHLEALLKKVDTLPGGDSGEMAVLKARAAHEAIVQNQKQQRRRLADRSLVAVITILLASIITLLITR